MFSWAAFGTPERSQPLPCLSCPLPLPFPLPCLALPLWPFYDILPICLYLPCTCLTCRNFAFGGWEERREDSPLSLSLSGEERGEMGRLLTLGRHHSVRSVLSIHLYFAPSGGNIISGDGSCSLFLAGSSLLLPPLAFGLGGTAACLPAFAGRGWRMAWAVDHSKAGHAGIFGTCKEDRHGCS